MPPHPRYVKQRPHVREFVQQICASRQLPLLVAAFVRGNETVNVSSMLPSLSASVQRTPLSLVASYREEADAGRIVCDECHRVVAAVSASDRFARVCVCARTQLDAQSGARFKCATCDDFDLCEACEPNTTHDRRHALLKVRALVPAAKNVSTTTSTTTSAPTIVGNTASNAASAPVVNTSSTATSTTASPAATTATTASDSTAAPHTTTSTAPTMTTSDLRTRVHKALFVADVTLPDGSIVAPGAALRKVPSCVSRVIMGCAKHSVTHVQVWRLQNNGSAAWPAGAALGFVGGTDFQVMTSLAVVV
jgi:hypothetical protein